MNSDIISSFMIKKGDIVELIIYPLLSEGYLTQEQYDYLDLVHLEVYNYLDDISNVDLFDFYLQYSRDPDFDSSILMDHLTSVDSVDELVKELSHLLSQIDLDHYPD